VGSSKGKLVIVLAGGLLALNVLQPSNLLAETFPATARHVEAQANPNSAYAETRQPDTKTVLNAAQKDVNLTNQSGAAAVSKAEGEIFYKMLLSVVVVIALGSGVVYVSKKVLPRFTNLPGKQIRIIETTHIAPRKGLHLVQVGVRRLLIASTNENITMLADVTGAATAFADELASRTEEEK
jgi:flagellar biogenesis protein FliO